MRLFLMFAAGLFACSIHAQSVLFVHVSGNNNGSAYTRIELNGINLGTLDVNEHLATDLEPGLNKITFNRRGYKQLDRQILNEGEDCFIKINLGGKRWNVNQCAIDEMPDLTSELVQAHKGKREESKETLKNHYSSGTMPASGSTILTLINNEPECTTMSPDVISNYINSVFLEEYRIVNRKQLSAILDEQKLSLSGLISIDESIEAGNLIGANYTLVVSYQCINDSDKIRLSLNVINCETSQVEWVGILEEVKPSQILIELNELIR